MAPIREQEFGPREVFKEEKELPRCEDAEVSNVGRDVRDDGEETLVEVSQF